MNRDMIRELATLEGGAFLPVVPRRHRWSDLQAFDEQLAEIERRREQLSQGLQELFGERNNEPQRHEQAIAAWFESGEDGPRPRSQVAALDEQIADRQADYDALGIRFEKLLGEEAEQVAKNRRRMVADVRKEVETAASEYAALVDQLEAKRQELRDWRATEIWAAIYPSEALANQPSTAALVGAKKRLQEPHLPGLQSGLVASSVFELLRADVRFCGSVSTAEQAAAEQGVTVAKLTGRDARWEEGSGKPDYVGPNFGAAWGGTPEEAKIGRKIVAYAEASRRRLWGE